MKKTLTVAAMLLVSATVAAQTQVYKPGQGVTSPEVVKEVKPAYTAEAMRAKVQGEIQLEGVVGVDGIVSDIKVIKSLDTEYGLDKKAIEAFSKWRFKPGMREGKPVPVQVTVALTFTLRDELVFDKSNREVTPPQFVGAKAPSYTAEAIRNKIEGVVQVEGVVQPDGTITGVRVVKGLDAGLDANAVETFKTLTVKPATLGQRKVPYRVTMDFTFTLRN